MLDDSFYEDDDYYWYCKTNNKPTQTTGHSISNNSLTWSSCSLNSSHQPDTSTSTFLSLPLKPVQSSSPNSKTQLPSSSSSALPHILSETFTNSSFSSSTSGSPPNSLSSHDHFSTSFSLSSAMSSRSSLSPDLKTRNIIHSPICQKTLTVTSGHCNKTRNKLSSFNSQKTNVIPWRNKSNNWLLPPLDPSSTVTSHRKKILVR